MNNIYGIKRTYRDCGIFTLKGRCQRLGRTVEGQPWSSKRLLEWCNPNYPLPQWVTAQHQGPVPGK